MPMKKLPIVTVVFALCLAIQAKAQIGAPAGGQASTDDQDGTTTSSGESMMSGPGGQNPFLGGVSSGQATPGVMALSLKDAIDRGLKYNLGLLLSQQGTR